MLGTYIRPKEVGKILLEIVLGFPSSFFLSVMVPLNLVHSNFSLWVLSLLSTIFIGYSTYDRSGSTSRSCCSIIS